MVGRPSFGPAASMCLEPCEEGVPAPNTIEERSRVEIRVRPELPDIKLLPRMGRP